MRTLWILLWAIVVSAVVITVAHAGEMEFGHIFTMQTVACMTQEDAESVARVDQATDGSREAIDAQLAKVQCAPLVVQARLIKLVSTWVCPTDGTTYVLQAQLKSGEFIYMLSTIAPKGVFGA